MVQYDKIYCIQYTINLESIKNMKKMNLVSYFSFEFGFIGYEFVTN